MDRSTVYRGWVVDDITSNTITVDIVWRYNHRTDIYSNLQSVMIERCNDGTNYVVMHFKESGLNAFKLIDMQDILELNVTPYLIKKKD